MDAPEAAPSLHITRSTAFEGLGRYEEALEDAEMAISLDRRNPMFHLNKGMA
jgi:hypothetical protein